MTDQQIDTISLLPPEIWWAVLSRVPLRSRVRCRRVCRTFARLVDSRPVAGDHYLVAEDGGDGEQAEAGCNKVSHAQTFGALAYLSERGVSEMSLELMHQSSKLESKLVSQLPSHLLSLNIRLTALAISDTLLTTIMNRKESVYLLLASQPSLERLHLDVFNWDLSNFPALPNLRLLCLYAGMWRQGQGLAFSPQLFPRLQGLFLNIVSKFSERGIRTAFDSVQEKLDSSLRQVQGPPPGPLSVCSCTFSDNLDGRAWAGEELSPGYSNILLLGPKHIRSDALDRVFHWRI